MDHLNIINTCPINAWVNQKFNIIYDKIIITTSVRDIKTEITKNFLIKNFSEHFLPKTDLDTVAKKINNKIIEINEELYLHILLVKNIYDELSKASYVEAFENLLDLILELKKYKSLAINFGWVEWITKVESYLYKFIN